MNDKELAAVKQALKDLKWVDNWVGSKPMPECVTRLHKAITDLQSIISQDALDKMAEDARTIGLRLDDWDKIGCVNHDCDKCKAVQEGRDWSLLEATQESLREHMAEIKRLKAAQPAVIQQMVDALDHADELLGGNDTLVMNGAAAGRWLLEQPAVQEPVFCEYCGGNDDADFGLPTDHCTDCARPQPVPVKTYHDGKPWPVAPKPWVGLSEKDKTEIRYLSERDDRDYVMALVEAKLKEKNHDQ